MPVVPRMEMPPTIPSLGFHVCLASFSPLRTEMVMSTSGVKPYSCARLSTTSRINWRGTGLMAGSPTGIGNPGRVTIPTPSPAKKRTPAPEGPNRTEERMSAPWVTSGSSPASLMIPASAKSSSRRSQSSANEGVCPLGSLIDTGSGKREETKAQRAALVAAVAQAPVVQPRLKFSSFGAFSVSSVMYLGI